MADFDLAKDFDRAVARDDETAARDILASGMPIDIARDDTPDGHVIRVYPDGREELATFDWAAAAKRLGG